jgi:hypothetical protein
MNPKVSREEHERMVDDYESSLAEMREENDELRRDAEPTDWLEKVLTRRILVHRVTGASIEGCLVAQYDDGITLRAAKLLHDAGGETPLLGETWIPRTQVAFAQFRD